MTSPSQKVMKCMPDVSLVLMPFAAVERPSLALGLLKSCLRDAGIDAQVEYANLDFVEFTSLEVSEWVIKQGPQFLLGEWVFAGAAFPEHDFEVDKFFSTQPNKVGMKKISELRERVPEFIDEVAQRVLASRPRIVGCSSVFQQHCASLALLRRIRELAPEVVTVMGGGNCEGSMGLATHRHFEWVDYVVSGEADQVFPELCRQLLAEQGEIGGPGVLTPSHRGLPADVGRPQIQALDSTPVPDFDDYFHRLSKLSCRERVRPGLPIETSRGCWWGEKHHCSFCGLNGSGMNFRTKSPERVISELAELSDRYQLQSFEPVDNILDLSYFDSVLPRLAAEGRPYRLFYETKANLQYSHLEKLVAAGVRWIQPGIESLHDGVLELIKKGTTGMANLMLLKWSRELGIRLSWNFIFGFPGEEEVWYEEMLSWLPLITHLQPPSDAFPVRIDRFSPYHLDPQKYSLELRPMPSYQEVYPLPERDLEELAYYFADVRRTLRPIHAKLIDLCQDWREAHWRATALLCIDDDGTTLKVLDTRGCARERRQELVGVDREVYLACDRARSLESLAVQFGPQVESVLVDQVERRLTLRVDDRYLALGVRGSIPSLFMPNPGGEILPSRRRSDA